MLKYSELNLLYEYVLQIMLPMCLNLIDTPGVFRTLGHFGPVAFMMWGALAHGIHDRLLERHCKNRFRFPDSIKSLASLLNFLDKNDNVIQIRHNYYLWYFMHKFNM